MNAAVDIRLGPQWRADLAHLSRAHARDTDLAHIDLSVVRDAIDIILADQNNITAPIARDCVFVVVADLLDAINNVGAGLKPKATVPFQHTPWELTLARHHHQLCLSLVQTSPNGYVALHNQPIDPNTLAQSAWRAADELAQALLDIHPRFGAHPLLRRLRRPPHTAFQTHHQPQPLPKQQTINLQSHAQPITLHTTFDAAHIDTTLYNGTEPLDLHALLTHGNVTLHKDQHTHLHIGHNHPVLTLRQLLAETHDIVRNLRSTPRHIPGTPPRILHATAPPQQPWTRPWIIRWNAPQNPHSIIQRPHNAHTTTSTTLPDLIQLITHATHALREALLGTNPKLAQEEHLKDMGHSALRLQQHLRDTHTQHHNTTNTPHTTPKQQHHDPHTPLWLAPGPLRFSWRQLRRVGTTQRWTFTAPHIQWDHLHTHQNTLWIPHQRGLTALDTRTGDTLGHIRHPHDKPPIKTIATPHHVLTLDTHGHLTCMRADNGQTLWRRTTTDHTHNALHSAHHRPNQNTWLILHNNTLLNIDPAGDTHWQRTLPTERPLTTCAAPTAFCVALDHNRLWGLDPHDGQLLWQHHNTHTLALWSHRNTLWHTSTHDDPRLSALTPHNGQTLWTRTLPAPISHPPLAIGPNTTLLTLKDPATEAPTWAIALNPNNGTTHWSRRLPDSGDGTTPPLLNDPQNPTITWYKTPTGTTLALNPNTGTLLWKRPHNAPLPPLHNAPLIHTQGILLAATDHLHWLDPNTGDLLHTLTDLPPHPAWLHTTPQHHILAAEPDPSAEEDTLHAHTITHFLAIAPT